VPLLAKRRLPDQVVQAVALELELALALELAPQAQQAP
jgi:hypothetical protein